MVARLRRPGYGRQQQRRPPPAAGGSPSSVDNAQMRTRRQLLSPSKSPGGCTIPWSAFCAALPAEDGGCAGVLPVETRTARAESTACREALPAGASKQWPTRGGATVARSVRAEEWQPTEERREDGRPATAGANARTNGRRLQGPTRGRAVGDRRGAASRG